MEKFKLYEKVTVDFKSGAEKRSGIIVSLGRSISKVEITYLDNGNTKTYTGWFQNKFLTKTSKL